MKDISVQLELKQSNTDLENRAYPSEFMAATTFCFGSRWSVDGTFGSLLVATTFLFFRWLVPFLFSVFPDAFLFDLTLAITSISPQSQIDSVQLQLENFPRIEWAIFVASRSGGRNLVFHWSAA